VPGPPLFRRSPVAKDREHRHRGICLPPNAFTTAALFAGFHAIVQAMNNRFEAAAIAIFVAMMLDGMDRRVARLTNTRSAFGEQHDSLSDMTSFGVAPALVMHEWILTGLGGGAGGRHRIRVHERSRRVSPASCIGCVRISATMFLTAVGVAVRGGVRVDLDRDVANQGR